MRTLAGLMVALALGLASAATAATVTVDTNKKTYLSGDSILVTTTLTVTGAEGSFPTALLNLLWSDPQILGTPGPAVYGGG